MEYRNTKQKQLILDILKTNRNHPTVKELYSEVKKRDASIGQATVYRNVSRLYQENKLFKISVDGVEHYDMRGVNHGHFYCKKCRKIYDIFDIDYQTLTSEIEKKRKAKIEKVTILLEGICEDCMNEEV